MNSICFVLAVHIVCLVVHDPNISATKSLINVTKLRLVPKDLPGHNTFIVWLVMFARPSAHKREHVAAFLNSTQLGTNTRLVLSQMDRLTLEVHHFYISIYLLSSS